MTVLYMLWTATVFSWGSGLTVLADWSHRHLSTGAVIARCGQPEVSWWGWRNADDEHLVQSIAKACAVDSSSRKTPHQRHLHQWLRPAWLRWELTPSAPLTAPDWLYTHTHFQLSKQPPPHTDRRSSSPKSCYLHDFAADTVVPSGVSGLVRGCRFTQITVTSDEHIAMMFL